MSDSLDNFFAKKDKKRGKDKGKTVLTAEALVRELEEGSKQVEYTSRKDNKTSAAIELLGLDADDGDWKDFEDIEERDYTGLKIKEISLQDQNDGEMKRLQSEMAETREEVTVWKTKDDKVKEESTKGDSKPSEEASKSDSQTETALKSEATEQVESEIGDKSGANPTEKKAYVPPSQRNVKALEPAKLSRRPFSRFDAVPNLDNEKDFPGLG